MKIYLLIVSLMIFGLVPMENNSSIRMPSDSSHTSSEDILYETAMHSLEKFQRPSLQDIERHIRATIEEQKGSPIMDNPTDVNSVNEVIIKAVHKELEEIRKDCQSKFTKKSLITICSVISSAMTLITGLLVHYKSNC